MKLCVYIYNYNVYTHTDTYGTHVQAVYVCADTQISEEDSKVLLYHSPPCSFQIGSVTKARV